MAQKLSRTLEDYLGAIFRLEAERGFARVRDIAAAQSVAKSAVTAALQSLSERGFVKYEPYEPVRLTSEGKEAAGEICLRREIMKDFLQNVLGLEEDRAETIACGMEHAVDNDALKRLVCFLAFVGQRESEGVEWLTEFRRFIKEDADGAICRGCMEKHMEAVRANEEEKG